MCVQRYGGQRRTLTVVVQELCTFLFFETQSLIGLLSRLDWLAIKPWAPACAHLLSTGISVPSYLFVETIFICIYFLCECFAHVRMCTIPVFDT